MGLTLVDLGVILIYLAGITMFGLRFRRQQRSLRDYFLADNAIPWWAISLSIVGSGNQHSDCDQHPGTSATPRTSRSFN